MDNNEIISWGTLVKIIMIILYRANLISKTEKNLIVSRLGGHNEIRGSVEDVMKILDIKEEEL